MSETHPSPMQIVARTDVGRRRSENQDSYGSWRARGRRLLAVADGMGGHQGGATASRLAIEEIGRLFCASPSADPEELLCDAFHAANRTIFEQAQSDPSLRGMGSTGVALMLEGDGGSGRGGSSAWVAHVGDSRLYRLRAGQLHQITRDHNLRTQLRHQKGLSEEEIERYPAADALLRALGPFAAIEADVRELAVEPHDLFLLCSDGLTGMLSDEAICAILQQHAPADAARVLVDEANRQGGADNITVLIASVSDAVAPLRVSGAAPATSGKAAKDPATPSRARFRRSPIAIAVAALLAIAAGTGLWVVAEDPAPAQTLPARSADPAASARLPIASGPAETAPPPSRPERRAGLESARALPPLPIPRPSPTSTVLRDLGRAVETYARGVERCDLAVLESIARPAAQLWARRRCEKRGPSPTSLAPVAASLREVAPGKVQIQLLEGSGTPDPPLIATLQRRAEDGEWEIADLTLRAPPLPPSPPARAPPEP